MSQGKGDRTNVRDASNLGILRRDALSHLLNLVLNYHLHLLPNQSELKFLFSLFSLAFPLHNDLITLLLCRKRKGEAGTSKHPAAKKCKKGGSKKGAAKKGAAASTSTSLVPQPPGTASTSTSMVVEAPVSPGPTTRRMAVSISTLTNSPTTRRMAAQLDISPGGIARRVIIN